MGLLGKIIELTGYKPKKEKKSETMAKKFDVIVHDNDLDNKLHARREVGVMAENAQELRRMYAMCDQTIDIEREYEDDESRKYGTQGQQQQKVANNPQKSQPNKTKTEASQQTTPENSSPIKYEKSKEPPKYFEIGGIKCKMENGKMYQKQWMRLSENEASEFRIVSDKNNRIIELKDKHIEIMKWVLVQDESSKDESSSTETKLELLND